MLGVGAVAGCTGAGIALAIAVPEIGAPALALLLGAAVRPLMPLDATSQRLVRLTSKRVLQWAIVCLGGTFGLGTVVEIGGASLPLMLGTLGAALIFAAVFGRVLRVGSTLTTLIGVGTAICGASAIGAVSGVVEATEAEIAYSIATIFVFNIVAVVAYPAIGHAVSLSQHAFGLWTGTAVNDTSSVVAAASAYGHAATNVAVVTKLARTTMIVPIVLVLAARRAATNRAMRVGAALPWFLLWFLSASALRTAGLVPSEASGVLTHAAAFLITVALAAVGLSASVGTIRRTGFRPLVLGACVWAVVATGGLLLQRAL